MKLRLVFAPAVITLMMAAALLAQPPAGGRRGRGGAPVDPSQRIENMLTRFLTLDATQQNQVHTILADAKVQSQGSADQLKTLRTSLIDAIKTNNTAQIDSLTQQISLLQQQQEAIRSKAAANIYASLSADQKTKLGNGLGMLMGGGFGPGMRRGGPPPKQ
jgi:Spy/CpxP family protein refolding chaperone